MKDLRRQVIRLAHNNPELRPHLLPLLEKTSSDDLSQRLGGFNSVASPDKEWHQAKELLGRLHEVKDRTRLVLDIIQSTHQNVSRSALYPPNRDMNLIYKRLVGAAYQLVENCYLIEIYLGARGFRLASQPVGDRIQYRGAIKAIDEMMGVQQEVEGILWILQQTSNMLPFPSGDKHVSVKFKDLISDCHTLLKDVDTYVKLYATILDDAS